MDKGVAKCILPLIMWNGDGIKLKESETRTASVLKQDPKTYFMIVPSTGQNKNR